MVTRATLFWATCLVALAACSPPAPKEVSRSPAQAGQSDWLFVWSRPAQFPMNLPITQSATCRFRKSLAVGFQEAITSDMPHPPEGTSYSAADEDEAG